MQPFFVKTFSKGQMTIPKVIRQKWGVGDDFWMKVRFDESGALILMPIEHSPDSGGILDRLSALPKPQKSWFSQKENEKMRNEVESALKLKLKDW